METWKRILNCLFVIAGVLLFVAFMAVLTVGSGVNVDQERYPFGGVRP